MKLKELSERMFIYRMDHELTQQQLADLIGIDRTYVNMIENGRRMPGKATLYRMIKFFSENP